MKRLLIAGPIFIVLLYVTLIALGFIFCPPVLVDKVWTQFEQEELNSIDALFFGSSHVMCSVNPMVIFDQTGITSYVLAGTNQSIEQTRESVEQSLDKQSPFIIFVEVCMAENSRVEIDRFENWQFRSLELTPILYWPYYTYKAHARWKDLWRPDFAPAKGQREPFLKGARIMIPKSEKNIQISENTSISPSNNPSTATEYSDQLIQNANYLADIADICQRQNINLVFFCAPSKNKSDSDLFNSITQIMQSRYPKVEFCDFNAIPELTSTFVSSDFYDNVHLTLYGGE